MLHVMHAITHRQRLFADLDVADYLSPPDAILEIVRSNGKQDVQQYALLAGIAGVAVDVDEVAAEARVHLRQSHSLQPVLIEGDVILPHHLLHHFPTRTHQHSQVTVQTRGLETQFAPHKNMRKLREA